MFLGWPCLIFESLVRFLGKFFDLQSSNRSTLSKRQFYPAAQRCRFSEPAGHFFFSTKNLFDISFRSLKLSTLKIVFAEIIIHLILSWIGESNNVVGCFIHFLIEGSEILSDTSVGKVGDFT